MPTRRLLSLLAAALVGAVAAARPAAAQRADVGASGAPLVRLSTPGIPDRPRLVGQLVESTADVLAVRTGAGEVVEVPRSLVRLYEVSRGRAPRGPSARRAALVGLALGAVVGAATTPDHAEGEQSRVVPFTLGGAAVGAVAGWVFGSVNRPYRWQRAELPAPAPR